ncbi:HD-GYP domain-containing protein [Pseudobutyrivibrio xylanivorans]|uniref:HD domain-containing protein n=1 Tax=Pseudobutyrivibrio xylanivorans DSM 14809 TaxID=1123012 RepID=A0A1M6BCG4_PSEXY|nr:HD domain-containing phosphohydrolase [Pseudobutyrivibrio xylanivorans]SHI46396.1 HD domain-containing protein [Pseudobutyrivibrio xylanivorans DSM 14809]
MYNFIRTYQLDIMQVLAVVSLCFTLLLFITRFLEKRRKQIMIFMLSVATFLMIFERLAYMYAGTTGTVGYIMVRVSNFFVYFLTPCAVLGFDLYLENIIMRDGRVKSRPKRLVFISIACFIDMSIVVMSQYTGLFYYFDESNFYHRGPGFLLSYIVPVCAPFILLTVLYQYRYLFSKWIYISLIIYAIVPVLMGIIQVYMYGLSLTNMAMVLVSISLYVFTYIDINQTVVDAHNHEMRMLEEEKKSVKRLFDQTATAFMYAVEKRDEYSLGHSSRVAKLAKRIAVLMGKTEEECDEIYYAALMHNVGLVGIPDSLLDQKEQLSDDERKIIENVPKLSSDILSSIVEYPYLKEAALYSHERYDGNGYPKGLKGKVIPEIARIICVADAYDAMTSRRSYRGPFPIQTIREELIKQSGSKFDPEIAAIMVNILDQENNEVIKKTPLMVEKEIACKAYRDATTVGIPIVNTITKIHFKTSTPEDFIGKFSEPAMVLFDSFDGRCHDTTKGIEAYHYLEYGEVWFDGKSILTSARNLKVEPIQSQEAEISEDSYEIIAAKYEDHVKLEVNSSKGKYDIILALPDRSKAAYVCLTGENCRIYDIVVDITDELIRESDIPKIVDGDTFINRMESDVANVQIDQYRSASTEGIPLEDKIRLDFRTMSLPSAGLVWHCPYIVLYYADDQKIFGKNYREYALIKLNGEVSADEKIAENNFSMKKKDTFPGWDIWKQKHKAGLECSVSFVRKGNAIDFKTENLGIEIENKTLILDGTKEIYVSISGDQVALTDIRISKKI